MPTPGREAPGTSGYNAWGTSARAPDALPLVHADRGPRTAGGPDRRRRARRVPGAKERLLLAVLAAGAPGRGQHRPARGDALGRRAAADRPQVAAGPRRAAAQRPGARPAQGFDRPVRRPPRAGLRADGRTGGPSTRSGSATSPPRAARGSPRATPPRLSAARSRHRTVARGAVRRLAGRALRRRPSGGGWPRSARGAVAGLLEARLALGGTPTSCPELERLVAEEPLREDWWRLLMLALYRAGRQGDALAAGRRARALLAEELGRRPGPALRAMEAAILAQDPALDAAPGRAPRRQTAASTVGAPRSDRARTRGWPPTRSRTHRCSTGGAASWRRWWRGWSTHPSSWSRGRAARASPRSSGPVWSRRWPAARSRAVAAWRAGRRHPRAAPGRRPRGADRRGAPGRARPAGRATSSRSSGRPGSTPPSGPRSSTPSSG